MINLPTIHLSPRQKKILAYIGFPLFYLFALVIFVRVTFPYETVRRRLLAEYNTQQADQFLEIEHLSGSGMFGVEAEGVRLVEVVSTLAEVEAGPPKVLVVEEATIGLGVLSYLFGNIAVDFAAKVEGGDLVGDFFQDSTGARIKVVGSSIDMSGLTLLSAGLGLPLDGQLGGQVELFLPGGQMKKAEGSFNLTVDQLTVGDGKAKIRNTIALPKLNAGLLTFQAKAVDGRLDIEKFTANGKDFELSAEGKLRLREPFDKSTVAVDATFKFKEAYTAQNDITKSIFGAPDSKVPGLFDMDPMVRRAKQPDGAYSWNVTGLLGKPKFEGGRRRGAAAGARAEPDE